MSRHLQKEIQKLKKSILAVGTLVEESLHKSVQAFFERDLELANKVIENDNIIDEMEVEVEEDCLKILALHQPVAIDLRFIISVLKINNDLERIGDLASNIAGRAKSLATKPSIKIPKAIPEMVKLVQEMLKKSLDALVAMDVKLAEEVLETDTEIDKRHSSIYPLVQQGIETDLKNIVVWIQLLGISRYLERAADHTTNIAEDVIYMVEGEIKRHTE